MRDRVLVRFRVAFALMLIENWEYSTVKRISDGWVVMTAGGEKVTVEPKKVTNKGDRKYTELSSTRSPLCKGYNFATRV
jgi:hypothetical protein